MKITKNYLIVCFIALFNSILDFSQAIALCNDPMNPEFLLTLVNKMQNGENVIFTKFGDGEYNSMINLNGSNCDGDAYNPWVGKRLRESLISLSQKTNTYIGKWWTPKVYEFCNQLAKDANITIPWTWYHLFLNDDDFSKHNYLYSFVEFVINTDRKKIVISNESNRRLKDLFRATVFIEIPPRNWSYEYDKWLHIVEQHAEKDSIILISGGMCSKVIIDDITNKYDLTCIDLGSSFDLLASKRTSRGWKHTYQAEYNYYKNLLPPNWD